MIDNKNCQTEACVETHNYHRISIGRLSLCYKKHKLGETKENTNLDERIKDLNKRMTSTTDDDVVRSIYDISKTVFESENGRTVNLDTKGNSILTISGGAASMFIAVCGLLIRDIKSLQIHFEEYEIYIMIFLFIASILLLLVTIGSGVFVIGVRKFKMMSDEDVFNEIEIKGKLEKYQRFMSTVYWKFFITNYHINNEKANSLKTTQILFFYTIISIFVLLSYLAIVVFTN